MYMASTVRKCTNQFSAPNLLFTLWWKVCHALTSLYEKRQCIKLKAIQMISFILHVLYEKLSNFELILIFSRVNGWVEKRNKAWVWGVGEGDRAGLHDVLHHVLGHLWVNTHVENIIKIKPKHHHEEHHDAPHEPHLLCVLEVSWEHPRCLDPHGASH